MQELQDRIQPGAQWFTKMDLNVTPKRIITSM